MMMTRDGKERLLEVGLFKGGLNEKVMSRLKTEGRRFNAKFWVHSEQLVQKSKVGTRIQSGFPNCVCLLLSFCIII